MIGIGIGIDKDHPASGTSYLSATGGTVTTDGDYKVHTFTGDGNFQIISGSGDVEYLIVGGGGSGGG